MKRIAQHFIMSKMADHITSGSCYYTTSGNDATAITGDDAIFCDRFSAGWFESLISPKHPRRFSCYTAVIVVEILYT